MSKVTHLSKGREWPPLTLRTSFRHCDRSDAILICAANALFPFPFKRFLDLSLLSTPSILRFMAILPRLLFVLVARPEHLVLPSGGADSCLFLVSDEGGTWPLCTAVLISLCRIYRPNKQTRQAGCRSIKQEKGEEKITSTKKKQNLEWWISTQQKKDMYG